MIAYKLRIFSLVLLMFCHGLRVNMTEGNLLLINK